MIIKNQIKVSTSGFLCHIFIGMKIKVIISCQSTQNNSSIPDSDGCKFCENHAISITTTTDNFRYRYSAHQRKPPLSQLAMFQDSACPASAGVSPPGTYGGVTTRGGQVYKLGSYLTGHHSANSNTISNTMAFNCKVSAVITKITTYRK